MKIGKASCSKSLPNHLRIRVSERSNDSIRKKTMRNSRQLKKAVQASLEVAEALALVSDERFQSRARALIKSQQQIDERLLELFADVRKAEGVREEHVRPPDEPYDVGTWVHVRVKVMDGGGAKFAADDIRRLEHPLVRCLIVQNHLSPGWKLPKGGYFLETEEGEQKLSFLFFEEDFEKVGW